jgi:hypothetical protein
MSKPNLFCVGYPKCGTSALWNYLSQHPDIYTPKNKDLNFFSGPKTKKVWAKTESEYMNYYQGVSKRIRLDMSTDYIYSERAPYKISSFNPNAKIIICIRHPLDLLFSLYLHEERTYGTELPSFRTWLDKGKFRQDLRYLERIKPYVQQFGSENINIFLYEEFDEDNQKVMTKVYNFLDIKTIPHKREEVNTAKTMSHEKLVHAVKAVIRFFRPISSRLFSYSTRLTIGKHINHWIYSKNKPEMKNREKMKSLFDTQAKQLCDYLDNKNLIDPGRLQRLWDIR